MRVLFISRNNLTRVPAGDTVQVLNTKKALEKRGVRVDLGTDGSKSTKGYDLVHLFNTIPIVDVHKAFGMAKDSGVPIVLSPIYWDAVGWVQESSWADSHRLDWWEKTQLLRRETIMGADLLLPNAVAEAKKIEADYHLPNLRYQVIPNAAEEMFAFGSQKSFQHRHKIYGEFALCSARIDARKNQLALIEALEGTKIPLVFAGVPGDASYYRLFKEHLGPCHHYLGILKPKDLADAYAAARVHVLPSWYDTPGLSSLEAGLAGCRIVSTERGTAQEYFGQDAYYCDPASAASIKAAVIKGWKASANNGLRLRIAREYNWNQVARKTMAAYHMLLEN